MPRVVVTGYPEFYDLSKSSGCIGLSTTDRTALDGGADLLDSVIQAATAGHAGFAYADIEAAFGGHEICDSSSWLHSVDWLESGRLLPPDGVRPVRRLLPGVQRGRLTAAAARAQAPGAPRGLPRCAWATGSSGSRG